MVPYVSRSRVLELLRQASSLAVLAAPAGFGKSTLLDQAGVVRVAVGATEGHAGLLADAIAQRLKRAFPGALGAARALSAIRSAGAGEPPSAILARVIAQLPEGTILTLAFDELERLPTDSDALEVVRALVVQRPAELRLILSGRPPLPTAIAHALPAGATLINAESLALDEAELATLVARACGEPRPALVARIQRETLGWPALVAARLDAGAGELTSDQLAKAFGPTVDQAVASLRGDVRFLAQIAAVARRADLSFLQSVASGDVPGVAEARRRLVRLEPAAVARARDELERLALTVSGQDGESALHPAVRVVLRERFRGADLAGFLEANRRAGELLLAARREPDAEVVELFSVAEERERVMDILARHGSRLELELAELGDDRRILGWIEALERAIPVLPFWGDALAGLVEARLEDSRSAAGNHDAVRAERARERLERARVALAGEKKEAVLWRWQPRLAEAQAHIAKSKGAWADARAWLVRGLDQVAQTKKRGIAGKADEGEASALELRMLFALARLSRESATWDKTREPCVQALALLERLGVGARDPRRLEVRAILVTGGASAGDRAVLAQEARHDDALGRAARAWRRVLEEGHPGVGAVDARMAWEHCAEVDGRNGAAAAVERAASGVLYARLAPMPDSAQVLAIVAGLGADRDVGDPAVQPYALEAQLRSARALTDTVSPEGWLGALQIEMQAREVEGARRPRALEGARDAWRRVGARWEEIRLFLELAALAERRANDGETDARDALARALDGAIDAAAHAQVAVPWDLVGDARRLESVLRAGFRFGSERVRTGTRTELDKRGMDVRTLMPETRGRQGGPPGISVATAGQAKRLAQASGAAYVALGRTGAQALSETEYHGLVESKSPGTFVVVVPEKVVLNFGRRLPLGQKRIMLPLLLELLRHPEQAFSMLELAQRVWDAGELTPTVVTKVKVAVSRLRALLGRNRAYINTTRKDEEGESVVAYQVAPQLNFLVVETARD